MIYHDDYSTSGDSLGEGVVIKHTVKALLISLDDLGESRWIPRSVIHEDSEVWSPEPGEASGEVVVEHWWASKEGLV